MPGFDQAAQGPLRLGRPDGVRVGLGRVLEVPDQVGQARLVPGQVLPAVMEVVDVPVGDGDAGEVRQDAEVAERFEGAGAQEQQRVLLGERAQDVLLLPGRPARSVVSSNPATCAAVISVRISLITSAASSAALRRQEWMNPAETRRRRRR